MVKLWFFTNTVAQIMTTPSIHFGDFSVYTNKKETTIAVSYSDCAWNVQLTYTQVIIKMIQFLVLK